MIFSFLAEIKSNQTLRKKMDDFQRYFGQQTQAAFRSSLKILAALSFITKRAGF